MITRAPKTFSSPPVVQLNYATDTASPIILRRIPDMTGDVGADGTRFDEMLRRWVGKSGTTNTFWLMNIPPGTYDLYVYTGSTVTTKFTVMVNGGPYQMQTAIPTGGSTFVQNDNFVIFPNLVIPLTQRTLFPVISAGGMIELKVEGTISGLQLRRL